MSIDTLNGTHSSNFDKLGEPQLISKVERK
uniref:Uncharacterized protein n=1 Tax=Arundo donax TaxID=35708 RepID=A0A0A9AHF4_ARUDO